MKDNYSTMLALADNCRFTSNIEVNGKFLPGKKLGLIVCEDVNEFFWYTENSTAASKYHFTPLFLSVPQEIVEYIEKPKIFPVFPGDYFIADGIMYYYDIEKFEIYRVVNYLNLDLVYNFAKAAGYEFQECSLVKMEKHAKEYYCWLLKLYPEDEIDNFTIYALPVFGGYGKEIAAIDWTPDDLIPLNDGDTIIQGDKLYRFEIKPDNIEIIEQDIDIDFKSLFN